MEAKKKEDQKPKTQEKMKELEGPLRVIPDDTVHTEIQDRTQQEFKLFGHVRLKKGMTLWEIVMATGEIRPVNISRTIALDINTGEPLKKARAIYDPKCFYVMALNKKNAIRKYNALFFNAMKKIEQRRKKS